jgi:F0F1-type ATP synthase membrane subunit b/b'
MFSFFLLQALTGEAEWLKLIVNLGAFGLVSWLVYYVFKTMLPKITADFTAQLEAQRKSFGTTLDKVNERHHTLMREQRNEFRAELAQQRADFKAEVQRERDLFNQILSAVRKDFDRR